MSLKISPEGAECVWRDFTQARPPAAPIEEEVLIEEEPNNKWLSVGKVPTLFFSKTIRKYVLNSLRNKSLSQNH